MTTDKNFPKIGNKAPAFSLLDQNSEKITLKSLEGNNIVLFFYPKAMTPGCTVQANGLKDIKRKLSARKAIAIGISPDAPDRLEKFQDKEGLNFPLLSDEDHKISEKYGVWQLKKNYGREYMGIVRTTFIIGKTGKLIHIMEKVKTKTHHEEVLALLDELNS